MSGELSERSETLLEVEGAVDPGPGFDAPLSIISYVFCGEFPELLDPYFPYL